MSPINAQVRGLFSTPATLVPVNLSIPCGYDEIEILNLSDFADAGATTQVMRAKGYSVLPVGSALQTQKTNFAATMGTETMITTGGFTFTADSGLEPLGAPVINTTAITQANPGLVNTATPLVAGDIVRIYSTTAMLQIAGMDFTVGTVVGGVSMQLAYLNTAGFAAAGTAAVFRKVPFDARFYPRSRYITAITQAAQAVVTLSVTHGYLVGQKVRMKVPTEFGMLEMNDLLGTIVAINTTTNTITLDINSTAMTVFAFPTSAIAATGVSPAQVFPVGEDATYQSSFGDAVYNTSFTGVQIDTGVLVASKNYAWFAKKSTLMA